MRKNNSIQVPIVEEQEAKDKVGEPPTPERRALKTLNVVDVGGDFYNKNLVSGSDDAAGPMPSLSVAVRAPGEEAVRILHSPKKRKVFDMLGTLNPPRIPTLEQ